MAHNKTEKKNTNQYSVAWKATGSYQRTDSQIEDQDLQSNPTEQTNPGKKLINA